MRQRYERYKINLPKSDLEWHERMRWCLPEYFQGFTDLRGMMFDPDFTKHNWP
jgi:hypothetical protein